MEGLNLDNILGEQEIETLFMEPEETENESGNNEVPESKEVLESPEEHNDTKDETTEVVDPETLFDGEEQPESVGSGKETEENKGDTTTDEDGGISPNFYSSIASALAVDGIFPNSDEEAIKKVDSAETLSDLIESEIAARLDEKQQRVSKALDNGVEPDDIRKYENTLSYIASIKDTDIMEESEKGEQLRRNLIYQDFLNKGYSPEKAQKFTERTIDAGTDVEDAKEALLSNKEYFQNAYNKLLKDAQTRADEERAERQKQSEKLRDSMMKDKQLFGDMEISQDIRRKAFEVISKPVYKDPETGQYLTALQKYEMEHRAEFLKYAGLFMALTDGFKDFESFTKGKVKKEVKKGIRELERTLNGGRKMPDGSRRLVSSKGNDPESYFNTNMTLDL